MRKIYPAYAGSKLPPDGDNMQGFNWTPWNATSRTTAQDALWQHILNRNTSSQPFMTPCARQVMNRIPGNVTPPWTGCWGPPRSYSVSGHFAPLILGERGNILTSTEKPTNSKADPPDRNPSETRGAPRGANPRGRKEDPLPAVRINGLEVHRGSPRPDQRLAYRENISL